MINSVEKTNRWYTSIIKVNYGENLVVHIIVNIANCNYMEQMFDICDKRERASSRFQVLLCTRILSKNKIISY